MGHELRRRGVRVWVCLLGLGMVSAVHGTSDAGSVSPVIPLDSAATVSVTPWTSKLDGVADQHLFPRYKLLEPNVDFWTRVFGEYSEHQSVIHSMEHLDLVFEVLDFRGQATHMDPGSLRKLKNAEEAKARADVQKQLKAIHAKRGAPQTLNAEQRRIYKLFDRLKADDNRFLSAAENLRAQRGLRERTYQALEISGKYLPAMENVFDAYELPLRLTRLPLVESSFNVDAYSKVGAAGLWQFIPSSARIYMRLDEVVDDRRDPWTSTDAAARHLRDDYAMLKSWPLALTAYNHGRGGVARGLRETGGTELPDLVRGYKNRRFGFASRNFYAEFLAAADVERNWKTHFGEVQRRAPLEFDVVETRHYVPYETLKRLGDADDEVFRKLNPAYRPEVMDGRLYVPPGHLIRVPAGSAKNFEVAYASLGAHERFDTQRLYYTLHKVRRGDTLSGLASRYGVTQAAIASASNLKSKSLLRIGQVVKVPPKMERRPGPVTVAMGESKPGLTRTEQAASKKRAPAPKFHTHRIRSGQTLTSIARRYNVTIAELRRANGLGKSSQIRAGEKLRVPVGSG